MGMGKTAQRGGARRGIQRDAPWGAPAGVEGAKARALASRGWSFAQASIVVEVTRSVTGTVFGLYEEEYPRVFGSPVWARWEVDFLARTAAYALLDGVGVEPKDLPRQGDSYPRVTRMQIKDVGGLPLDYLVRGACPAGPYDSYGLAVARRDWSCDLYAVRKGEHFVFRNPRGRNPLEQYVFVRLFSPEAKRLYALASAEPGRYEAEAAEIFRHTRGAW